MANMQELIVAREEFAVRQESNKILIRSSARWLKYRYSLSLQVDAKLSIILQTCLKKF